MASVSVEGRGSLVNVEGFSDLSRKPLLLPHQDLGVIQCVTMTGGRGVFRDGRVEVYEVLKKDPITMYKNRSVKILREWKKAGTILDSVYHKIYPTSEDVPKFYGLPKITKKDSPIRPIVSGIGSISYKTAKYLAAILNPLTGKNRFTIKKSEDFVNKIKDLEVPQPRKMVSYDVSALFTSIPVDEAIHVI